MGREIVCDESAIAIRESHRTVELMRRRNFIQASPDQLSHETRSRRCVQRFVGQHG
ncbi:MAG: hypothetical protein QOD75_2733 [Blastocatellia bacterium]|jgi:hypothetical protein|nr:hypothetical protein [Blastocatellia bacterium]